MLLRGQAVSPLSPAVLRVFGNSAPSTSNSALSRCHIHSVAVSFPQLAKHSGTIAFASQWARGGGRRKVLKKAEEAAAAPAKPINDDNRGRSNGNSSGSSEDEEDRFARRTRLRRILMVAIMVSAIPVGMLLRNKTASLSNNAVPADAPHVDFDAFAEKYLKAGEVKSITILKDSGKAVATLCSGTFINGDQWASGIVVVDLPIFWHSLMFEEAVRKAEAEMGVSPSQAVPIEEFDPLPGWRAFLTLSQLTVMIVLSALGSKFGEKLMRTNSKEIAGFIGRMMKMVVKKA